MKLIDERQKKWILLRNWLYVYTTIISKHWPEFYYIDGFSGPGLYKSDNKTFDGSPLISLKLKTPFTHYIFVEKKKKVFDNLLKNIKKFYDDVVSRNNAFITKNKNGEYEVKWKENIIFRNYDINKKIVEILNIPSYKPFLIFLDPCGLELNWKTMVEISKKKKPEFLLNFSITGVNRCCKNPKDEKAMNSFFGSKNWKDLSKNADSFLEFYKNNLSELGFFVGKIVSITNETNSPMYHMLFGTKNKKAFEIMKKIKKRIIPVWLKEVYGQTNIKQYFKY